MCSTHLGDVWLPFHARKLTTHQLRWRGRETGFTNIGFDLIHILHNFDIHRTRLTETDQGISLGIVYFNTGSAIMGNP
ncbi:hypothetical protein COCON_G00137800 [Conger conger]|uniref:Uncharacterized protein n=1 Tax=Conger conger TaxID=82655 RepID=A0A9Q1DF99_CONCO|nr:hypothetical protein COCON_G00137800 [Conger conger]